MAKISLPGPLVQETRASLVASLRAFFVGLPHAFLIVVLGGLLILPGLARIPLYNKGEPREGIVVQKMVTKGEWILPLRNNGEIPSKPPLFHWLAAAISLGGGQVSELTVRLPSALLGILAALVSLRFGAILIGPGAGFLGAIVLLTNFQWFNSATAARVDMTLTFFVLVSLMAFYRWSESPTDRRRWLYAFYTAMGLATLAKGPVGIVLPTLIVFFFLSLRRELSLVRQMEIFRGFALVAALAGFWYALAVKESGWEFFHKQIIQENLERFLGGGKKPQHPHPVYYLPMVLMAEMFPWSLLLPALTVSLWRERRHLERGHHYLVIWTLMVLLFFSFSKGKRGVYLLPLYPPLSLLIGWWVERHLRTPHRTVTRRTWLLALWVTLFVITSLFAVTLWSRLVSPTPLFLFHHLLGNDAANDLGIRDVVAALSPASILTTGLWITLSCLFIFHGVRTDSWRTIFSGITLGIIGLIISAQLIFYPIHAETRSYRTFARECVLRLGPVDPLYFYRTRSYEVLFYAERDIPEFKEPLLPLPTDLHPRSHWILEKDEWERLRPRAGGRLQEVLRSNTGRKGVSRLVLVRLADDLSPTPPGRTLDRVNTTRQGFP